MNELAAIKKFLGVRIHEEQLNHYTLLGLNRNAGQNEIKQALRTAVAAWNSSDTKSDPESAQHIAKLIKQAQAVLLNASKKLEYDETLEAEDMESEESSMQTSFFPQADPLAAFDPSACMVGAGLGTTSISYGSPSQRWNELSRRIPMLTQSSFAQPIGNTFTEERPVETVSASATRIVQLKRNRKLKQSLMVCGFVAVAILFLGFAGFKFLSNRQEVAKNLEANASEPDPTDAVSKTKETTPKTIGGRNAPKSKESDSVFVLPTLSKDETSGGVNMGITEQNPTGDIPEMPELPTMPVQPMPVQPIPVQPIPVQPIPVQPIPNADPEPMMPAPMTAPMISAPMKPAENTPMVPAPKGASKVEWVAAMVKGKEALNKADFPTFHKQMELALPMSSNDDLIAKQARLDQLGQLYEIFIKSVHEAKSKMRGADTLSVGKTLVSIVEVKEDELIVRIKGENERFAWDRLPPGIATAMADLTLSDSEPTDVAARAVYFSLSPSRNDLFAKKVTDWFAKSVGKGPIRKDLVQALTDTYE